MTTTFIVDYQKPIEGEFETETKEFTDKDAAIKFATEHYAVIEYITEDETANNEMIDYGFVNGEDELVSQKPRQA